MAVSCVLDLKRVVAPIVFGALPFVINICVLSF
jgi:hypothetical protein